jgi:enoyl-[acyl-carrier protein] reductase/trans-2-enoyl-CoA reductase (NAD+)
VSQQVVTPRIRGFIALNAHPEGCAAEVRRQAAVARAGLAGRRAGNVLVIGSSTGYGLATLLCASLGLRANVLGVCLERPADGERTASAGWYNLAEAHRLAAAEGLLLRTVNGDAFSPAVKQQVGAELRARFGPLDYVVYSLAAPRRTAADGQTTWQSVLKPIGAPYRGKSVDLRNDAVVEASIEPASPDEIAATVHVMGGEDWADWLALLRDEHLLNDGCRTVAYSYVGPEVTQQIYRSGTIGRAKEHLEATAGALHASLADAHGGGAWVSVQTAVVTQASAAIPGVPLYMSLLFAVLRERGQWEGTIEQIVRLFRDELAPGATPRVDAERRIRLDDRELDPAVQAEVASRWARVTTQNLRKLGDYAGYQRGFERLFGFGVDSIDYTQPVELEREFE